MAIMLKSWDVDVAFPFPMARLQVKKFGVVIRWISPLCGFLHIIKPNTRR
jgi:hypothetical protein